MKQTRGGHRGPRQYGLTPLAIRAAAARVFLRQGFADATIGDIAAELGRPKGSIHYHIDSKQDLLYEVLRVGMAVYEEAARRIAAYPLPAVDRLHLFTREHLQIAVNPDHAFSGAVTEREIASLKPAHFEDISRRRREYRGIVQTLIEEATEDGDLRVTNSTVATRALLSVVVQVPRWYNPSGRLTIEELADMLWNLVLNGLTGDKGAVENEGV